MLELPILGLLTEEPLHGYELKKRLDETVGVVAGVSYGSLYPALRRLERAGAIEVLLPAEAGVPIPATGSIGGETAAAGARAALTERGRGMRRRLTTSRRKRKEYRITDSGRELLAELLKAGEDAGDGRAFALKLAFCRHLEPPDRLKLFERRRDWLAERLARVRAALSSDDSYTRSLVEHDGESTRRDLEWVERLIEEERAQSTAGATRAGEQGEGT